MYGEVHILVGIALQQAGPLEWALPAAVMSHVCLDDLNVGAASIYRSLGDGWRRWLMIAARVLIGCGLVWYLWEHPVYLIGGLVSWLSWDWEWIAGWFLGRRGLGLHERMFPAWLRSRWGLLVNLAVMVVLFGLVRG